MIGPGFSFSQDVLAAVGDAALGVHNTAQWSPDLDNPANKAFVAAFQSEYGRLPSVYASQGYDTAHLILSAHAKADVSRRRRLPRRARGGRVPRCAATSRSTPTTTRSRTSTPARWSRQDGVITNRIVGAAFEDHADAYAAECSMA